MRTAFLLLLLLASIPALARDTCPLGLRNDSLPGQCAGYRDLNHDSLCDLSQNEVEGKSVEAIPVAPRVNYHFWEIFLVTGILGLATELLSIKHPKNTLALQTAWNWLLLVSFLTSAFSGLYFVLPFEQRPAIGLNISYWHTVTGILFIAVGLYHTIRRFACMLGKRAPCPNNGNCRGAKKQPE